MSPLSRVRGGRGNVDALRRKRFGNVRSGQVLRDALKHSGIPYRITPLFISQTAADLMEFVNQRYLDHKLISNSCAGVTRSGDTKRRRAFTAWICSNLLALAKCLQFQVTRYCIRYQVAKAR